MLNPYQLWPCASGWCSRRRFWDDWSNVSLSVSFIWTALVWVFKRSKYVLYLNMGSYSTNFFRFVFIYCTFSMGSLVNFTLFTFWNTKKSKKGIFWGSAYKFTNFEFLPKGDIWLIDWFMSFLILGEKHFTDTELCVVYLLQYCGSASRKSIKYTKYVFIDI